MKPQRRGPPRNSKKSPAQTSSKNEGRIERLNTYGEGTLSWQGNTVKMLRTVPGDLVRFKVEQAPKRFLRGTVTEILQPSPDRIAPNCVHFTEGCGGCQWLHISYAGQLKAKTNIVADQLLRLGIRTPVLATLGMPQARAYRNKMSLTNVGGRLAFLKEHSEEPVFLRECIQESPENQQVWAAIRELHLPPEVLQLHLRSAGGKVGVNLFVKHYTDAVNDLAAKLLRGNPIISGVAASSYRDYRVLAGSGELEQELGGIVYRMPLNGFFQTNYEQALVLRTLAVAQMELEADDAVIDVYCGSGFFTLDIARTAERVIGIENSRDSIQTALANARLNKIENTRFIPDDAARGLSRLKAGEERVVLLDPPRQGCTPEVLQGLARLGPERIVYVSCSPDSLARDVSELAKSGYRLVRAQPVDMFPHTFHVEIIATLVKEAR